MQHLLARKMIGQRLAEGLGGLTHPDQRRCSHCSDVCLDLFKAQPELIGLAREPLRRRAELHSLRLGWLHLEPRSMSRLLWQSGARAAMSISRRPRYRRGENRRRATWPLIQIRPATARKKHVKPPFTNSEGCAVRIGCRHSTPSSSIDSCAALSTATPSGGAGQVKRPRSSRLANRHRPCPSHHSSLTRSPRLPRNAKTAPPNGSRFSRCWTSAASPSNPLRISVTPAAR